MNANGPDLPRAPEEQSAASAFDDLLRSAAPPVPDAGPGRRQLRTLLHDRLRAHTDRAVRRRRLGLALSMAVVFVLVSTGDLTDLGSDDFALVEQETVEVLGMERRVMKSPVRSGTISVSPNASDQSLRDVQEAREAADTRPRKLTGSAIDGGPVNWEVIILVETDGTEVATNRPPRTLDVPNHPPDDRVGDIPIEDFAAFLAALYRGELAGADIGVIVADGVRFDVQRFSRTFPGVGRLDYYIGSPASSP